METETRRICANCDAEKAISEFSRSGISPDGLQSHCRPCHTQKSTTGSRRRHLKKYAEKKALFEANGFTPPPPPGSPLTSGQLAHRAVAKAKRDGDLPQPTECEDCTHPVGRLEYHHESYAEDRWLDVTPLCKRCHSMRHRGPRTPVLPRVG